MRKIIVLGDTHGRDNWKQILSDHSYDKAIFIGDYFDTHEGISPLLQLKNFKEIFDFKMDNMPHVELLIGNHDYHYLTGVNGRYSGFQHSFYLQFNEVLQKALPYMSVCAIEGDYLFSHAGFTRTWCRHNNIYIPDIVKATREAFGLNVNLLEFDGVNNYGDDITQSPIWVRPRSLMQDGIDEFKQVVGHTTQDELTVVNDKFYFIDTLGTSGEFLYITDGVAKGITPKETQ